MRYFKEIAAVLVGLLLIGVFFAVRGCGNEKNSEIVQIQDNVPGALPVLAQNEIYKTNRPVTPAVTAAPIKFYKEGEKTEKPPVSAVKTAPLNTRVSNGD